MGVEVLGLDQLYVLVRDLLNPIARLRERESE
jgi:hypothetical protein